MAHSQRRAGVVLGYANIVVRNLVSLVYTPMLLSFVGQADYGVYQSCGSFVGSLTLLSVGFSGAYVRFYTQRRERGTEADVRALNGMYLVFYIVVTAACIACGLALSSAAGLVFSAGFTEEQVGLASSLIAIMTFNVASSLFSTVFDSYIVAHERFAYQQTRQLATTLATPFGAWALLSLGMGAVGVALAQLAVSLVLLGINARFAVGRLGMRFSLRARERGGLFRAVAVFSGWLFANQICDLVNLNVPNVLLGALASAEAVAVFAVASQIRGVFYSLSTTISNVFVPRVNLLVATKDSDEELTALMARVGRFQMLLLSWIFGGFIVLGRFFVAHWAGEAFGEAYWLVIVMVAPLLVPLSQNVGIEIQKARNMHGARSTVYLVAACINVAFTCAAVGGLGCWAPAIAYAASILVCNAVWMNWYYQRRVGLDMLLYWRRNVPVVLAAAGPTLLLLLVTQVAGGVGSWGQFVAWGLAYTAVFAALQCRFVLDDDERSALRGLLGGLLGRVRGAGGRHV